MEDEDARAALEQLIRERREDYSALSRLIGRNAAYIQQFVKRGIPRRLAEEDRRTLANYFGVPEAVLGGPMPSPAERAASNLVPLPRLDVAASAGPGALGRGEAVVSHLAFEGQWLRRLSPAGPEHLSIIIVDGDSMAPALMDGDEIMVDRGEAGRRVRDGIYVVRRQEELIVKRLALDPATGRVAVTSDNPVYPSWPDCEPASLDVVGRVIWAGRRIR
ncbi:MAG: helix-turn-helix transcriptional regulator [Alphaproteobacteria bacterium]|nr:MAG: helix-turn-helix transcriptional regulator [Alphaproteobacteria bacterium]